MKWVRYQSTSSKPQTNLRIHSFSEHLLNACLNLDVDNLNKYCMHVAPLQVRESLDQVAAFFDYVWKLHPEDWWVKQVSYPRKAHAHTQDVHFEVYAGDQAIPYAGFTVSAGFTLYGQINNLHISHYYILSDALLVQN